MFEFSTWYGIMRRKSLDHVPGLGDCHKHIRNNTLKSDRSLICSHARVFTNLLLYLPPLDGDFSYVFVRWSV